MKFCGCMPAKLPRQALDLKGERFGKLLVVAFSHSDKGCWWLCRCDCGTERAYRSAALRHGRTQSCGCSHADRAKKNAEETGYTAQWKRAAYAYYNGARQRGIPYNLSYDETIALLKQDCHYCKAPPSNVTKTGRTGQIKIVHSGIDRVDNTKGYETGNVVSCCKVCNLAKRDMTTEEFLTWVHRVARHTTEPAFDLSQLTDLDRKRHPVIEEVLALYDT